jgi:hypothetical protein
MSTEHKIMLENIARAIGVYCCHADNKDHLYSQEIILYDKTMGLDMSHHALFQGATRVSFPTKGKR